jgi:ComF family protein
VALARLLSLLAPPLCWSCGSPAPEGQPLCRPCRAALRWLGSDTVRLAGVEAWAAVAYEGPARALVRALKFRGATGVADAMAAQIAALAPGRLIADAVLVPVPLHPARLRRRGFNQAERLTRALASRTGLQMADCLERRGPPAPQVGRTRTDRATAMKGAVAARTEAPGRAIIVDDVATTGATLAACAAALREGGSLELAALAYARTPAR